MIRLTTTGGARLRAMGRAMAIGLVMLVPLAAAAADAGFTDRIIVKYRTRPQRPAPPPRRCAARICRRHDSA